MTLKTQSSSLIFRFLLPLILFLVLAAFFIASSYFIDNTNYITGNGIYKTISVLEHLAGQRRFDVNHVLHTDLVVLVFKLLKLNNWPGFILTKMAVVNSLAAAAVLVALSLTLWQITRQLKITVAILISYLFSAYFFFLAISSEDIMPSLAALAWSIYGLFKFFHHQKIAYVIFSGVVFALAILLHRTVIIGLPAFVVSLFFSKLDSASRTTTQTRPLTHRFSRQQIKLAILTSAIFIFSFVLTTLILGKHPSVVLWLKPDTSGWSGFTIHKFAYTFMVGIGQSLINGANIGSFNIIFNSQNLLVEIPTLIFVLGLILWLIKRALINPRHRWLSVFLLINLFLTELVNLRTQGQDPQFQIPALLILPLGLGILFATTSSQKSQLMLKILLGFLAVFIPIHTLKTAFRVRGFDSQQVSFFNQVAQVIDPSHTAFLTHGFDSFPSWGRLMWQLDPWSLFGLVSYPVNYPDLSIEETNAKILSDIEAHLKRGRQVVTTDVLLRSDAQLNDSLSTVDTSGKAAHMKQAILTNYNLEFITTISPTSFYRLTPKVHP